MTWPPTNTPTDDWDLEGIPVGTADPMNAWRASLDAQAMNGGRPLPDDDMLLEPEPPDDIELLAAHPFTPLGQISTEPPPPLLVDRIDPEGHTILYGTGGSGKGALCCWWITLLVRGGSTVLVLDYEDHGSEWSRRIASLAPDAHAADRIYWYRPRRPLWQEATDVARWCEDAGVNFIVIDSAVMGCLGNDPLSPEAATMYAAGVTDLRRPTLSLAHVTKADDMRYAFGSVMWHNLARTTWSLQPDKSGGSVLTHRKHNNYAALGRFLMTATWVDGRLLEVWEKGYSASLADRALEVLEAADMSLEGILEALNDTEEEGTAVKKESLRRVLTKHTPERFRLNAGRYTRA